MALLTLDLGSSRKWLTLQMKWGSHTPILAVLVMLFVIPHDPSTKLDPTKVGSEAFGVRPFSPSQSSPGVGSRVRRKPAAVPASRVGVTPQATAAGVLSAADKEQWPTTVAWLLQCAMQRPLQTKRVVERIASRQQRMREADVASLIASVNSSAVATTVEALRQSYGDRQSWWGDLNGVQARELYHSLMPTMLLDEDNELPYTIHERARLAVAARRAARLYVRERATLDVSLSCELLDGVRQLVARGAFQPDGLSEEQVWAKYARDAGLDPHDLDSDDVPEPLKEEVCKTILRKACTSNKHVDAIINYAKQASHAS